MLEGTFLTALDPAATAAPRPTEAYASLRALIMSGAIPPGERINIEDAARRLSVSPTPVREALAGLESEGLVLKVPLRGYRTTELLTREELVELYELRRLLEPDAAAKAARRHDAALRQALDAELATMSSRPAPLPAIELAAHDERLHGIVFEGAGNSLIARTYARTHCHLHIFRLSYSGTYGHHTVDEHAAIVAAIDAGDDTGAAAAMREHLDLSLERVLGIYS
ncbi:GntR family transcriptional regulator [Herbiconiux daphne]|uniref:GntR family transcriptional regulator n=1 Tax=Herbiconiux daphne TaxID=2970914 RepID=A0ABT2H5S5_9MICO|nr:GntR family transcriptional regulator [Herbiconiux daphne]MCS5735283.1 GntR family transcriptional regulator [Herbiconiux daphne]